MTVALTAARLFDGVDTVLTDPVVLVADGVLTEVRSGDPPPDALDLGDVTLLPGFVDTHGHLALDGSLDAADRWAGYGDAELRDRMRAAAARAVAGGVTTVRDLGAPTELAVAMRAELAASPGALSLLVSGAPVTVPGGHGHFLGGAAAGPGELRAAVRALHDHGVDVVKVMGSGGRLTPGSDPMTPQFSDEELAAIVGTAHDLGLPVTVHAYAPASIAQAVTAGVDGIEHCFFSVADGLAPDPEVIDRIAEREIWVCPTLGLTPDWPVPPGFQAFLDVFEQVVTMMHKAGVRLLAGTDSGALPGKPHDATPHAVIKLAELGLPNVVALRSATSAAAAACGLTDRGVLRAGARADIVAVAGDPVTRIEDLAEVRFVMAGGTVTTPVR